ncbi:MAG: 50S ribosomal protein L11 methyltransferase [Bacteroidota bacterium]
MHTEYLNLHIGIKEEFFDFAIARLTTFPIKGIEEKYDELVITFLFSDWTERFKENLLNNIRFVYPEVKIIKEEKLPDKNWNEEWEKNVQSVKVNNRISIAPLWKIEEVKSEFSIIINPKMSFGTGEHATTRLCCKLLENVVSKDSFWIDAGTGTGVLAILEVMLGANRVLAFDNNEWSIENAKENFLLNNASDKIKLLTADIDNLSFPKCDGISANLFFHLLVASFDIFYSALKETSGDLIVSGVMKYDYDDLITSAVKSGFYVNQSIFEDEWCGVHFKLGSPV